MKEQNKKWYVAEYNDSWVIEDSNSNNILEHSEVGNEQAGENTRIAASAPEAIELLRELRSAFYAGFSKKEGEELRMKIDNFFKELKDGEK